MGYLTQQDSIMKFALVVAALVSVAVASSLPHDELQFAKFREEYGKSYHTRSEHQRRFSIFTENLRKYEQHNKSGASWEMGVTKFSDLTDEEFEAMHMGGYKKTPVASTGAPVKSLASGKQLPESVDWREKGAISPVKDQQACGSCWAFAATAMIESYAQIETNEMPILSAQQVTACTPNPLSCGGTGGCMGSIPQLAFTYIQLFGHVTEDEWPYTAGNGNTGSCEYDYNGMPPSVGLVGYGSDADGDYWIVRNSWGTGWGEDGYIRLRRDATAQCGTDSSPMDGTACADGPGSDEQHVCGQCGVLFDVSYPLGAHNWSMP